MEANIAILSILVIAVLGRANSVAAAACFLLIFRLLNIDNFIFPWLEKNGLFWGLVILTASILIPIASGRITLLDIRKNFTSWVGILALLLSLFTTYLSGLGLQYLTIEGRSDIMPALILGAVIAAAFFKGVPVGPLVTSGLLALFLKLIHKY
ncbi:Uncharacterized membrane protein, DUF441 family [Caloramator quimbayensis]|uniref:UPF0756 membrane protein SAMN05443428_103149 n=1 Tax=Caloramator quimbayensis TaxID=1147123 RepID=A0A1T4WRK4_9CLOT|nr:DUF441 domain-containing protein [Caloramator quimbayensis]SKA80000.1 Uncharacterized membrane protein, DUF441 family [Caloramator quimbayensis]